MNIWTARSTIAIWILAGVWLTAFNSCAPARERVSAELTKNEEGQAKSDAQDARDHERMCASESRIEEICNPPEDVSIFCFIVNDCGD